MIKSRTSIVKINRIHIPQHLEETLPKRDKIEKRCQIYRMVGEFDREIVVDENFNLIDGYSTYLACKELNIKKVRVLRIIVDDTERIKELKAKLAESERLRMVE